MFATVDRSASGYLVEIDDFKLWMDAGGGTWQRLLEHLDYPELGGVLLTHRHPDHTIDVFQCFHARLYGGKEVAEIPLWAPEEALEQLISFAPELARAFDLTAIRAGEVIDVAGAKVSFFAMAHPPDTCGVRIEHDGAVLAYSADTGPSADVHELARDADVFLCEATLDYPKPEGGTRGHLAPSEANDAFQASGAKRLLLTHRPKERPLEPEFEQVHDGFELEL